MFDRDFPGSEIIQADDAADVADAVAAARAGGRPVYPVGGGTCLDLGAATSEPGCVLLLRKLNRLVDYPSGDLTITVEAGMTMAELARHVESKNQWLPIDVAGADSATVGGVVAANLSGPRRYRFGTMRDYLLGFTAVDGRGEFFRGGARVVKNAAGYDLPRLMVGSLGTLGVVTQVTLMVRPKPEKSVLVGVALPSLDRVEPLLEALAASRVEPTAVELACGDDLAETFQCQAPAGLWIGFEGGKAEVEWMGDEAVGLCRSAGLEAAVDEKAKAVDRLWRTLTERGALVPQPRSEKTLSAEITVLPSKTVETARHLLQRHPEASLQGRAAGGVLTALLACEPEEARPTAEDLRELAASLGGRAVVTAWPAESRLDQQTVWGPPGPEMRVMQRIKEQFDPDGIFNTGRFVFAVSSAKDASPSGSANR